MSVANGEFNGFVLLDLDIQDALVKAQELGIEVTETTERYSHKPPGQVIGYVRTELDASDVILVYSKGVLPEGQRIKRAPLPSNVSQEFLATSDKFASERFMQWHQNVLDLQIQGKDSNDALMFRYFGLVTRQIGNHHQVVGQVGARAAEPHYKSCGQIVIGIKQGREGKPLPLHEFVKLYHEDPEKFDSTDLWWVDLDELITGDRWVTVQRKVGPILDLTDEVDARKGLLDRLDLSSAEKETIEAKAGLMTRICTFD